MTQAAVEHGAASGAAVLTVHKALGLAEGGARAARTVTTAQDPPTILRVRSSIALMVALTSMACRGMPLPLSGTIHPYGLWDEPRSSPRGRNDTRPRGMRRTDSVCYERTFAMDSSIVLEEAVEEGNLYTSAEGNLYTSAQCLRAEAKRRMASSRHQQQPLRLQPHDIFSFLSP